MRRVETGRRIQQIKMRKELIESQDNILGLFILGACIVLSLIGLMFFVYIGGGWSE